MKISEHARTMASGFRNLGRIRWVMVPAAGLCLALMWEGVARMISPSRELSRLGGQYLFCFGVLGLCMGYMVVAFQVWETTHQYQRGALAAAESLVADLRARIERGETPEEGDWSAEQQAAYDLGFGHAMKIAENQREQLRRRVNDQRPALRAVKDLPSEE